jgi:hypothetical protein
VAIVALGGLILAQGVRPDLTEKLRDPAFLSVVAASILTAGLAIHSAFAVCVPGHAWLWRLAPIPAVLLWVSAVGAQCLTDWVRIGPEGVRLGEAAHCMATVVLASLPLGLALALMLRGSNFFRPRISVLLGSLAVAGVTSTALSLLHPLDASAVILVLNLGVGAVIVALGGVLGTWANPHA